MKILGLDCSSATVGISVLNKNDQDGYIEVVYLGFYKPPKDGNLFERLNKLREEVFRLIDCYKPDEVVIEDIIAFMKGNSQAATTLLLAVFNRTAGLAVFNKLNKPPKMINVVALRHALKENKIFPKKQDMPELLAKKLNIKFPYVYKIKGKDKGKIADESYDMADGLALSLGYLIKPELAKPKEEKKQEKLLKKKEKNKKMKQQAKLKNKSKYKNKKG